MINKKEFQEFLEGKLGRIDNIITERAETAVANLVVETAEPILEMTDGHKAMMKQHFSNLSVVDYTPQEKDGLGKILKYPVSVIKNALKNDKKYRDDYNQLGDNPTNKLTKKNNDFVGKNYTTNERQLRSE